MMASLEYGFTRTESEIKREERAGIAGNSVFPILHIKSVFVRGGGIEKQLLTLVTNSTSRSWLHHVALLVPPGTVKYGEQVVQPDILGQEKIGAGRWHRIPWIWKDCLASGISTLRQIILSNRIRLLHCHDNRANFLGLVVGKALGIPLVTTLYGYAPISTKLKILINLDKFLICFFERIVCSSPSMLEHVPSRCRGKTAVVYNAIDPRAIAQKKAGQALRHQLGIRNDQLVVAMVGRLSYEKGWHILLEAIPQVIAAYPHTRFIFAGDGPEKRKIQKRLTELSLESLVHLTGFIENPNLVYAGCDIYVQTSLTESLPLTILEAMAHEKPVIATDVGSVREAVIPGRTGFMVPYDDVSSLSRAIQTLLKNPQQRQMMGAEGKRLVQERFTYEVQIQQLETVYHQVLQKHSESSHPNARLEAQ